MRAIDDCIKQALKENVISKETADEIMGIYDGNAQEALEKALQSQQRKKYISALNKKKKLEHIAKAQQWDEGARRYTFSILTKDPMQMAGNQNVEYTAKGIQGYIHSKFADAMNAMRTKRFGFTQDKQLVDDTVREIFGKSTGNTEASKFAKQWSDVSEELRQWYNRVGGDIPKLNGWGLPQSHNWRKVRAVDKEEWKSFVKPLIQDIDDDMLDYTYDTISTGGLNKIKAGESAPPGISSMKANKRQEHRFLHFKDGDAWLQYQKRFGATDAYATMLSHIDGMANDIAIMKVMGPDPDGTFNELMTLVDKQDPKMGKMGLEGTYNVVSGKVDGNMAKSAYGLGAADFMGAYRNLQVAGKLGSATLSAISDVGIMAHTAGFNGLSPIKTVTRGLKELFDSGQNMKGIRAGLIAETMSGDLASTRFNEMGGAGWTMKAADAVMRASGLSHWTNTMRKAFGMELSGFIGDNIKTPFEKLPKELRDLLGRGGVNADDWKIAGKYDLLDGGMIDPQAMAKGGDVDTAVKILAAMQQEIDMAVITPDARTRAITTGGAAKGTALGEGARLMLQFKSFPITLMLNHFGRAAYQSDSALKYMATMFIVTTALGYVALTAKDLASGKTPKDPEMWQTWGAAAVQGGGLGIFGDFLFSDQNRFGNGFVATVQGPIVGDIETAMKITLGNIQQLGGEKDTGFASETAAFMMNYIPGQNLWYTKLIFERAVKDTVQELVDPDYKRKVRKKQRAMKKDFKQEYWWKP